MPMKSRFRELAGNPARPSVSSPRSAGPSGGVPGSLNIVAPVGKPEIMDNSAAHYADPPMQLGKKGSGIPGVTLPQE